MASTKSKKIHDLKSAAGKSVGILPSGSFDTQLKYLATNMVKTGRISNQLVAQLLEKYSEKTDLTTRERLIVSALSNKKLSNNEWSQLLAEADVKPKLHRDSTFLMIQLALENGQSAHVLKFAINGKSEHRVLVHEFNASPIVAEEALKVLTKLRHLDFESWKKFAVHIDWLSSLVSIERVESLFESLIAIIRQLEISGAPKPITKTIAKKVAKLCVDTIFVETRRLSLLDYLGKRKLKKEEAVSLISSISQLGLDSEVQILMIRAFGDADCLDVISDRRVWSSVEINSIAAVCSHKQIFKILSENPELIERQINETIRTRTKGLGLMIQLCDQFPNFVALIGNKHIASVDLSIKPSAKIFSSISEKITLEVNKENAKAQEALQRAHEIEINALQAVFEEKTIEADLLQRKIRELETKISEVRTEKSLAQDTVIRQARIDVITMLAEVIDEIRVILEEMEKIDDSTIENLYRSSLRKIGKVDVQVIFPSDKSRSSDPNLFASQESASFGGTFLGRPAYVYIIGGKEYVLRRGVVIKSR